MNSFRTVLIDPPWLERGGGKIKRGADKHYALLDTPSIIRTTLQAPHWNEIADSAHLYLWVTNNFLPKGLEVMAALGFRYITNIVWVKNQMGLGQYFRGKHELCLFGVRGKGTMPRTEDKSISTVIVASKTNHSRKPDEFYGVVERRSVGPYLEIFARERRDRDALEPGHRLRRGWTCWGDEA